uniref:S-arrestin n=1 Tax=Hippocampus comes TaxID=109280 RepID=A0A3Q2YNP7_HIPCM
DMSPKQVVFKKASPDKSVSCYRGNNLTAIRCRALCTMRTGDRAYAKWLPFKEKGGRVYVMLSCTFVYGRRDEDVMGAAFRRDLFVATRQVFPELQDKERLTRSKIQEKLLRKLGRDAFPFFLELPDNLPNSVTLQPGPSDVGKKCAVEFQVKAFRADDRSSVSLTVRKVQFGPRDVEPSPFAETTFDFLMSDKPLRVKLSLPKETFGHGEPLRAEVRIANWSNRRVKDISLSVEQVTNVVLYSNDKYVKSVAKEETSDGVAAGSSLAKSYTLYPRLEHNKERRGLALDGHLKHQDTNLTSGIQVRTCARIQAAGNASNGACVCFPPRSEVRVELPFRLMHPKPEAGTCRHLPSPSQPPTWRACVRAR